MGSGGPLIALLGVPGSGKSIVAQRLSQAHGFRRLRFTDPLADMLDAGFSLTDEQINGGDRHRGMSRLAGLNGKQMFVSLTKWARDADRQLLATEWSRRLALIDGPVVNDDIQRPEEADAVWAAGGLVARIVRPGTEGDHAVAFGRQSAINADIELKNTGSYVDLHGVADTLARELAAFTAARKVA